MVRVDRVLDDLCRDELRPKKAGDYATANGVRLAVMRLLRAADATEPSIDPSDGGCDPMD